MKKKVSEAVVRRLPRYYRYLRQLEEEGVDRVSSSSLGEAMNTNPSQIRQDLNCFGGFGQQGYGYNVRELRRRIANIIGLDKTYYMIIVGAGNIGQALAKYSGFEQEGYRILALFDINQRLHGMSIAGVNVHPMDQMEEFVRQNEIDIAILTVPGEGIHELAEKLSACGVKAIWNFAPIDLSLKKALVENAQLTDGLMALTYKMNAQ